MWAKVLLQTCSSLEENTLGCYDQFAPNPSIGMLVHFGMPV